MAVINSIINLVSFKRLEQIEEFRRRPHKVQDAQFKELLSLAKNTEYGKKYRFDEIKDYYTFSTRLPVNDYDDIKDDVGRILKGEQNILWPTDIRWFAKSSGTTSDRSKFIPISKEALEQCHFRSGKDIYGIYIDRNPDTKLFAGKTLALGGSHKGSNLSEKTFYGDLSAVIIRNLPFWTYFQKAPNQDVALMEEFEEKIERIAQTTVKTNVTSMTGVPSWFLVLLRRVLEISGESDISRVWPNLELFVHGGVSFSPYREMYKSLISNPEMQYMETYNASEGFFAMQDDPSTDDMLLMLDYGIYYEFVPMNEADRDHPKAIPLWEVEAGKNYAMLITTNTGLWRYKIGDTVSFTSIRPYKIRVTGRTKHFINAFGEELIIDNAEKALEVACRNTGAVIREYTAAPIYFNKNRKNAAHQWLFEFITPPDDLEKFVKAMDESLRELNSDYDAKRYKNMTLGTPEVVVMPDGSFYKWLKSKNKLGGQHKIPRLANHREYVDAMLKINA
ncbi:MAG: GH3 auxin-responsive promoter family protein [Bacteroidota bacterium]